MLPQIYAPLGQQTLMLKCPYCPVETLLTGQASLKQHVSAYHREIHKFTKAVQATAESTCTICNKVFMTKPYRKKHQATCEAKLEANLMQIAGEDIPIAPVRHLKHVIHSKKPALPFSIDDGAADIREWEMREDEIDMDNRPPVAIQCDIRLLNWNELVRVQLERYADLFHVILMDPPWKVNLDLNYPVLCDEEIMSIPFEKLQTDGYLMIWIIHQKEEKIKAMVKQRGYEYKAKVTWVKVTKNGVLVNGSGVTTRHSTECLYIFSKGDARSISNLWQMSDVVVAPVSGASIKPEAMVTNILKLVDQRYYLELYAKLHNLRRNFVSIGNQAKGPMPQ